MIRAGPRAVNYQGGLNPFSPGWHHCGLDCWFLSLDCLWITRDMRGKLSACCGLYPMLLNVPGDEARSRSSHYSVIGQQRVCHPGCDQPPDSVDFEKHSIMSATIWERCLQRLEHDLSAQDYSMWISPLQARADEHSVHLLAPNTFVLDTVRERFLGDIESLLRSYQGDDVVVRLIIGNHHESSEVRQPDPSPAAVQRPRVQSNLDRTYRFESFVLGKSNEMAHAAAMQVAENPGDSAYNPLLLYGSTGLGKTHLLHAVGHRILAEKPDALVVYLNSEQFVNSMIQALRHNRIDEFKRQYRSVDALLIDDIQFFAGKDRSQEEFFHTFNSLLDSKQQIMMTCDRYPKEVSGLEPRLRSRFGWGLSIAIDPPDFETRVAILMTKAAAQRHAISEEVAYFLAKKIPSNVRDLEGALNTLIANARFSGKAITLEFAHMTLRDLLSVQDRLITIVNIQKTVSEYYKLRVADMLSKGRTRSIARPRQLAMAMAKELTEHSLPEIGDAFGGRDHTTVLHACRKIAELMQTDTRLREDYDKIQQILTT